MIKVEGVSWRLGVNMSEQDNTYRPVYQRYYIRKSTSPKVRPKRHPHPYIVNVRTEHRGHSCRPENRETFYMHEFSCGHSMFWI